MVGLLLVSAVCAFAQTTWTNVQLLGTQNHVGSNAELTITAGATLTAAAGSVVDFFNATVALPTSLSVTDLKFSGTENQLLDGSDLTLLSGSAFIASAGSHLDLSAASIDFPSTVVLTTTSQTLTGKTLISPIISSISSATAANLSLVAGDSGARLVLVNGSDGDIVLSPSGTGHTIANGGLSTSVISGGSSGLSISAGGSHKDLNLRTNGSGSVVLQTDAARSTALKLDATPADQDVLRVYRYAPFAGWEIGSKITSQGSFQTNAWVLISGTGNAFSNPSAESYMLGVVSDVIGPAIQAKGGFDEGSYFFSAVDFFDNYRFSIERDGGLRWGASSRDAMDTALSRTAAGTLSLTGQLIASGNLTTLGGTVSGGATGLILSSGATAGQNISLNPSSSGRVVVNAASSGTPVAMAIIGGNNSDNSHVSSVWTADAVYHGAKLYGGRWSSTNLGARLTGMNSFPGSENAWLHLNAESSEIYLNTAGFDRVKVTNSGLVLSPLTEATTAGAGSLTTSGGIYASKRIITASDIFSGGNFVASGGSFSGGTSGLTLNSSILSQPIVFKLNALEIGRFSNTNGNLLIGGSVDIAGTGGLKIFGSTASVSSTTGAFQVIGGVGIGGALNVGSTATFAGRLRITNDYSSVNELAFYSSTSSTHYGTVGIASTSGSLSTNAAAQDMVVRSETALRLTAGGATDRLVINSADGGVTVTSPTPASSTSTGALIVGGGTAIQKKAFVGDDLMIVPTGATAATVRLSGTAVTDIPGIWFRDGGVPTGANAALSGSATSTIVNGPSGGTVSVRLGDTPYFTLTPSQAVLQTIPLKVLSTTASSSTTSGSATFGGGIGVSGRTSTGSLSVGAGPTISAVLSTTASFDFPSITALGGVQDITVTVTGATVGNDVNVVEAGGVFTEPGIIVRAIVTAANTVTIRATNATAAAINPVAATYRVTVTKF